MMNYYRYVVNVRISCVFCVQYIKFLNKPFLRQCGFLLALTATVIDIRNKIETLQRETTSISKKRVTTCFYNVNFWTCLLEMDKVNTFLLTLSGFHCIKGILSLLQTFTSHSPKFSFYCFSALVKA